MKQTEVEYGTEAQTERDYQSLTNKQQSVVETIVGMDVDETDTRIAEEAGVHTSYVGYVRKNFPHIINERRGLSQVVADGGDPMVEFKLPESDAWKVIRMVSDDLSQELWRQARRQYASE